LHRTLVRAWNRIRGRTPDGYLFPSTYDEVIDDPETGIVFGVLSSSPEKVKRLREAAAKAGLDIEIADCPADPTAAKQPPQPVKEDR
jgi:hypothetical protein